MNIPGFGLCACCGNCEYSLDADNISESVYCTKFNVRVKEYNTCFTHS